MQSARAFQTQASGSRLAQAPIAYSRPGLAGINLKSRNLDAANRVMAERKAKSEETKHLDTGIRITAGLWESHKNKISQIKEFQKIEFFDSNILAKTALDKLLVGLRSSFEVKNPSAQQLTWSNVSIHAHESQSKFSSLQNCDLSVPLIQFFKTEFVRKKIGTQRKLESREIEIRMMYEKAKVFFDSDSEAPHSEEEIEYLGSKRKRAPSDLMTHATASSARPSKKNFASLSSKVASSSRVSTSLKHPYKSAAKPSEPVVILKSAFKPRALYQPQQWSKDIEINCCQFIRTSAVYDIETCQAELSAAVGATSISVIEEIEIAANWANKEDDGYVGMGYTKRGIYARFAGKEYVITQPVEGTPDNVRHVLEEEYKLLCQCHGFKAAFNSFAKERNMRTIPNFYFNFPSSILGKLVPTPSSGGRRLPYLDFIATPLLPYGDADPKIKKFTGNDELGVARDDLTKAIHAFTHFSMVYSHNNLVFCDLQGAPDVQQVMCLIDPQCHTSASPRDTIYWDGGSCKIDAFLQEHDSVCNDNWICRGLKLKTAIVEPPTPTKSPSKPSQYSKSKSKASISFITHDGTNA